MLSTLHPWTEVIILTLWGWYCYSIFRMRPLRGHLSQVLQLRNDRTKTPGKLAAAQARTLDPGWHSLLWVLSSTMKSGETREMAWTDHSPVHHNDSASALWDSTLRVSLNQWDVSLPTATSYRTGRNISGVEEKTLQVKSNYHTPRCHGNLTVTKTFAVLHSN